MYIIAKIVKKQKNKISPTRQIIISFLIVILLGAILLSLPISNRNGSLTFLNHLFVATSATCVTGLFPITISEQYTIFGQLVILIMIQIGGLGFLTFLYLLLGKIQKKLSLRRKMVLQEMLNQSSISDSSLMVRRILTYTFVVQGGGALLFMFILIPEYGWLRGVYYSIFHGISSFTNAGIDVFGSTSLANYQSHPFMLLITASLIILGSLGFIVWYDLLEGISTQWRSLSSFRIRRLFVKLSLHSKIVLVMTSFLLITATVILFFAERNNPETIGELSFSGQLLNSFFLSASSRTAGFTTFPTMHLNFGTQLILWLYMFIGGSPTGTAGGIKTTTFMITVLMIYHLYKGRKEIQLFGRTIHQQLVIRCFAVIALAFLTLFIALITLSFTEIAPFMDLAVEVISAFTTVGISHQITPELTLIGNLILMSLMFIGRVGTMTLLISFVNKSHQQKEKKEIGLPKEDLLIG